MTKTQLIVSTKSLHTRLKNNVSGLLGSIPMVIIGAMLSARLPQGLLRNLLAIVLLAIGLKLWWSISA